MSAKFIDNGEFMRLSKYFLPVSKEAPADAAIASHKLMLRTGMVRQNGAGIYTWLPMGLKVLTRIEQIVREEMNRAGAVEMLMPTLQQADLWRESGRYDDYGKEMLRITDRHDREMLFGPTNEELITDVFRAYVKSYKQLPLNLYHQQWKFRILADTGESAVFCDKALLDLPPPGLDLDFESDLNAEVEKRTQYYAATEEMHDEAAFAAIPAESQVSARGIEVGHIFNFGTKYSLPMNAVVQSADGQMVPVQMGSYGIGVSRLVGGIIEACHDENGIVWPESVAPWHVGLINMRVGDSACDAACDDAYKALTEAGMDVLYDDTDERAGGKFARMELIGLPWQIVIGPRGIENGVVEVKNRKTGEKTEMPFAEAIRKVAPK